MSVDKLLISKEISNHIKKSEYCHGLAVNTTGPGELLELLEMSGIYKIAGVELTVDNLRKSWEDANNA
tara:strand:+ start:359 stop:562 length:204 start_codon:yes stop_codon:yes gene_type:complete